MRISLPWDAPALLAWRTVAPAPPRWRTGRTSGPLLVSWKFQISTPPSSLSLYLAAYRYLSLHTQHIVSAPRPSVSAPRPSNLSTRPSNLGSTKAPPLQHCQSCTAVSVSDLSLRQLRRYLSIDIYLYHFTLWEEKVNSF